MTTKKQFMQVVLATGLVVVTLAGCLNTNQATSTSAAALSQSSSSDGGSGSVFRNLSTSSGTAGGAGSLTTGTTCQISSGIGSIENGIRINPNSPCLITRHDEGGTKNPGNGFGVGTGDWTPPNPAIACASPSPQSIRAGLSASAVIGMKDIDFASTGLFVTTRVTNASGDSVLPSDIGSYVAAISADGVSIAFTSNASILTGIFDVAFTASAAGLSGTCVVRVDNSPIIPTPTPEPRVEPQLACDMGSDVPAISANGQATLRFNATRGQLEPADVVGFRIRDDASNANLAVDPGVLLPADAAFGTTGMSVAVTAIGPRRIPFEKNGRVFAVVNGVEQQSGCPVKLVASQCVGTSCGPIPSNACGAGIDNYIVSGVNPTAPIQITTDLDPQGLASNLSLVTGNFNLAKASLLNVGIAAFEFKLLAASDLPSQESKVRLTFSNGSAQRSCDILVPKKDSLGGSGNGTGDGGTYQGIVGNVYRTPVNAQRLMRPMELPNPFRDNLLWSNFARNNWAWTNGLPGVSDGNDDANLKEWMQVMFGGMPLAFAKYRGYDLNHMVRTEFTVPYEGVLTLRSEADDGVLVFVDQPGPSDVPLTAAGVADVAALDALSNAEIRTAVVNNDGLHPLTTRDGKLYVGAARFAAECNGIAGLVFTGTGTSQRVLHQCLESAGIFAFRLYYYQGPRFYIGNLLKWSYDRIVVNGQLVACTAPEAQALMASTGITVPCGTSAFGAQNSSNAVIPAWAFKSYKGSAVVPPSVTF